jgi:hypothetical protein
MLFGREGPIHRIALRSEYNRHFLCAETSDQQARIYANRTWQNVQETFLLEELRDGSVTQRDPDLAGIRDKAAFAKLAAEERAACEKLWSDVTALMKRAKPSNQ